MQAGWGLPAGKRGLWRGLTGHAEGERRFGSGALHYVHSFSLSSHHAYTLMLRSVFSLALALAAAAAPAAQSPDALSSSPPVAFTDDAPPLATASVADCAEETAIAQDGATASYSQGNTATSTGGAQELGQSFLAPCDGTIASVNLVIQNAPGGLGSEEASTTVTLYDGAGTGADTLASVTYTFTLPPSGSAGRYTFPIPGDVQVAEAGVYTVFFDNPEGAVDFGIQGSDENPYADGNAYASATGSGDGAGPSDAIDLRFGATFNAPAATSAEAGAAGGRVLTAARPNPVREVGRFSLTLAAPETVTVRVVDALGRTVAVLHEGTAAGTLPLAVDVRGLAPGVYAVQASGETFSLSQALTVAR